MQRNADVDKASIQAVSQYKLLNANESKIEKDIDQKDASLASHGPLFKTYSEQQYLWKNQDAEIIPIA